MPQKSKAFIRYQAGIFGCLNSFIQPVALCFVGIKAEFFARFRVEKANFARKKRGS